MFSMKRYIGRRVIRMSAFLYKVSNHGVFDNNRGERVLIFFKPEISFPRTLREETFAELNFAVSVVNRKMKFHETRKILCLEILPLKFVF